MLKYNLKGHNFDKNPHKKLNKNILKFIKNIVDSFLYETNLTNFNRI